MLGTDQVAVTDWVVTAHPSISAVTSGKFVGEWILEL